MNGRKLYTSRLQARPFKLSDGIQGTLDQRFARNAAVVQAVTAECLILFDMQGFRPELSGTGRDGFSSPDGFIPQARVKSRNGRMPRRCIPQTDFWRQERPLLSVDY